MRRRTAALGLLLFLGGASVAAQLAAQQPDTARRLHAGWLVAGSFGIPGHRSEPVPELFTIGFQWTQLRAGRLGADLALGTMPRLLAEGVLVLGFRGGAALPVAVARNVVLLPSAGISLVGGIGQGGGEGTTGLNAGVAGAFAGRGSVGLRTGVTWHRFRDTGSVLWLLEVGFFAVPRRSP